LSFVPVRTQVQLIPTKDLTVSPLNVRRTPGDVSELQKSIGSVGLLQPIVVREVGGRFEVVLGQRRLLACKALKWKTVPAIKRQMTDREALVLSLTENVQIDSLDPLDRAEGTKRLVDELEKEMPRARAVEETARLLGKVPDTVNEWIRLLETSEAVRAMIRKHKIDTEVGARLASLPRQAQEEVAEVIEEEYLPRLRAVKVIAQVREKLEEEPSLGARAVAKDAILQTEEYSLTVSFSGSLYRELNELARIEKVTTAEIVRKSVKKYVSEAQKNKKTKDRQKRR